MQNFKKIGSKLTEKSPKIMRSCLIIFNLTASIVTSRSDEMTDLIGQSTVITMYSKLIIMTPTNSLTLEFQDSSQMTRKC